MTLHSATCLFLFIFSTLAPLDPPPQRLFLCVHFLAVVTAATPAHSLTI